MKITIQKGKKIALIFGASGLVGGFCLKELLKSHNYDRVISFGRKELDIENEKLEQHIVDFEKIKDWKDLIQGHDLFCCLGSTIKKAGSKPAFRNIDFEYPKRIGIAALENKVNQFILVSAVDANSSSKVFYNQVKGELEDVIRLMKFWGVHILQPSILLGERNESRPLERVGMILGQSINTIFGDLLGRYQPVNAKDVAKSMLIAAQNLEGGLHVYNSSQLTRLGKDERKLIE